MAYRGFDSRIRFFRIEYIHQKAQRKSFLSCPSSLREEVRRRETPAITEHPKSLTPTLSLRERE
jgi:hypothetical protein